MSVFGTGEENKSWILISQFSKLDTGNKDKDFLVAANTRTFVRTFRSVRSLTVTMASVCTLSRSRISWFSFDWFRLEDTVGFGLHCVCILRICLQKKEQYQPKIGHCNVFASRLWFYSIHKTMNLISSVNCRVCFVPTRILFYVNTIKHRLFQNNYIPISAILELRCDASSSLKPNALLLVPQCFYCHFFLSYPISSFRDNCNFTPHGFIS